VKVLHTYWLRQRLFMSALFNIPPRAILRAGIPFVFFSSIWLLVIHFPEETAHARDATENFIRSHFTQAAFHIIFAILIVGCSTILFVLRTRRRRMYSILEISFGILAGAYAANQIYELGEPDARIKALFATVAGIYIIIRGFDNWQQSKKVA